MFSKSISNKVFFPYDSVRKQQELLLRDAFEAVSTKKVLLAHAPTGLGKTAAVLSPAISYAFKNNKTVFFLTPKISQHEIAVELIALMKKRFGLPLTAVDLVGRKYFCIHPFVSGTENSSFYELCKRHREKEKCEFFKRIVGTTKRQKEESENALRVLTGMVEKKGVLSHLELKSVSENLETFSGTGVCPYEAATLLGRKADVIIADYYHVLNPGVSEIVLARLSKKLKNCIFVVDEAHNLPERIRQLASFSLSTFVLEKAVKELQRIGDKENIETLRQIKKSLIFAAKKNKNQRERLAVKEELELSSVGVNDLEEFCLLLREAGSFYMESTGFTRSALFQIARFLEKWVADLPGQIRLVKKGDNFVALQLKLLDPSSITKKIFEESHSTILMSGTLLPTEMYADLLGIKKERGIHKKYKTPFSQKKRLNLVVPTSTTKYSKRNSEEYKKIACSILDIVSVVPGNTAVFFPSFEMLETVFPLLEGKIGRHVFTQKKSMNAVERHELLKKFRVAGKGFGAVLLAVSSGMYAEGIDYAGEQLLCSVIVGIPLQEMNLETKSIIDYYEQKFGKGWHYGYIYPAMSRAIQAAGRVIRNEKDFGVSVFLDSRYLWKNYAKCFPDELNLVVTKNPKQKIKEFFEKM